MVMVAFCTRGAVAIPEVPALRTELSVVTVLELFECKSDTSSSSSGTVRTANEACPVSLRVRA